MIKIIDDRPKYISEFSKGIWLSYKNALALKLSWNSYFLPGDPKKIYPPPISIESYAPVQVKFTISLQYPMVDKELKSLDDGSTFMCSQVLFVKLQEEKTLNLQTGAVVNLFIPEMSVLPVDLTITIVK
jgi:hypothetical protein